MTHATERDQKADTYRVREAVGVFVDANSLEAAVDELDRAGFARGAISVLGSNDEVRRRIGQLYRTEAEMEDDIRAPRTSFVSGPTQLEDETAAIVCLSYIGGLAGLGAIVAAGDALAFAIAAAIMGSATEASFEGPSRFGPCGLHPLESDGRWTELEAG